MDRFDVLLRELRRDRREFCFLYIAFYLMHSVHPCNYFPPRREYSSDDTAFAASTISGYGVSVTETKPML